MGRPPVPDDERLKRPVTVQLTEAQYQALLRYQKRIRVSREGSAARDLISKGLRAEGLLPNE